MRFSTVPARDHTSNTIEVLVTRLHESHVVSVYEAIERLVQAGEAVGLDANQLLRMLDRGMSFEELLEFIEVQMECLQMSVQMTPVADDRAA